MELSFVTSEIPAMFWQSSQNTDVLLKWKSQCFAACVIIFIYIYTHTHTHACMYGGGMTIFNISVLTFLRWSTWERLKEALHWQYPCCCFLCHLYCIQFLFPILLPQQSRIFHYCHSPQLTIATAFGSNPQNAWKFIPFVHHIVLFSSFQKFSLV